MKGTCQFSVSEVNCAAIPSELIESELFGHVKETLPAVKDRAGKFEAADRDRPFDEIGDMSLRPRIKVCVCCKKV
jgi:transcriptional regulator with GAF, ATPase, and Fis domain